MDKNNPKSSEPSRPITKGHISRPITDYGRTYSRHITANKASLASQQEEPVSKAVSPKPAQSSSVYTKNNNHTFYKSKKNRHTLTVEPESYYDFPVPKKSFLSHRFNRINFKLISAGLMVLTLIVFSASLSFRAHQVNEKNKSAVAEADSLTNTEIGSDNTVYDTEPVSQWARQQHNVDADFPRLLQIQKINLNSRIQKVNIDSNGDINVPKNIYDIGWYEGSPKPGEKGVAFLNGQANYRGGPAVFANLGKLIKGDEITIQKGNGDSLNYTVIKSEEISADKLELINLLDPVEIRGQGLTLMTYSGEYDQKTNSYQSRVFVFATKN